MLSQWWQTISGQRRNLEKENDALTKDIRQLNMSQLRQQGWQPASDLRIAGYEYKSLILTSIKLRRYLILIQQDAYEELRRTNLLRRFDASINATLHYQLEGIFLGENEEMLLLQSQLQQSEVKEETSSAELLTAAYRNFDLIVERAIEYNASDIHFQFREHTLVQILYRIHGKLRVSPSANQDRLTRDYAAMLDAVSTAYNSRADSNSRSHNHFDEAQHQSCSIPILIKRRKYQIRFQSIKENHGFDIILRLLMNEAIEKDILSLAQLGYSKDQVVLLEDAVNRSPGLTIIAGETGSGKSTTLRTLMTYERDSGKKFYSIEDPVEYIQPHVTQIPIQRRAEGSSHDSESPFSAASRVILRGDPDKLMPGEIRDVETGSFAKSMTETGHQVLSTVHASSAFGIIPRLASEEVGMPLSTLSAPNFLTAIVYQKLIATLCPHCSLPAVNVLSSDCLAVLAELGLNLAQIKVVGPGCAQCRHIGNAGQTVVAEVCEVNEIILPFIRKSEFWEAERHWRRTSDEKLTSGNMAGKTAIEHAIYKVSLGLIDPREVESAFYTLRKYLEQYRQRQSRTMGESALRIASTTAKSAQIAKATGVVRTGASTPSS